MSRDLAASLPPIYSALFDWLRRKETPGLHGEKPAAVVVIEAPSLKLPALALSHSSREFPALSRVMREALADGIDTCIVLDASRLPAGVVILNADELGSIGNGRVDWERLARRVPGATGWLGLSQPLLSADRRDAVVYVARYCQGLCGEGRYVWLRRAEDGQWSVSAWLTTWMS